MKAVFSALGARQPRFRNAGAQDLLIERPDSEGAAGAVDGLLRDMVSQVLKARKWFLSCCRRPHDGSHPDSLDLPSQLLADLVSELMKLRAMTEAEARHWLDLMLQGGVPIYARGWVALEKDSQQPFRKVWLFAMADLYRYAQVLEHLVYGKGKEDFEQFWHQVCEIFSGESDPSMEDCLIYRLGVTNLEHHVLFKKTISEIEAMSDAERFVVLELAQQVLTRVRHRLCAPTVPDSPVWTGSKRTDWYTWVPVEDLL
jgi:hypothetical protein